MAINPYNTKNHTPRELLDWMQKNQLSAVDMRRRLVGHNPMQRYSLTMGKLYFFIYDPKHKDTLPMYDKFPLVFPIERYQNGFLGLNVHYLGLSSRRALFSRLTEYATSKKYTDRTRLTLTYDLMQSSKKLSPLGSPCVKRYLFDHVRSWFVEIPATEWDKAYQLPVQNFVYNT